MNKKNGQVGKTTVELFDLQKKFIDQFMAEDSSWGHLLVAPVGLGKTYLSISLTNKLIKEQSARRILFLVPTVALLAYYETTMEKRLCMPALIVDRKRFRLLEDSIPLGKPPWPKEATVVMSIDVAKIHDVADSL